MRAQPDDVIDGGEVVELVYWLFRSRPLYSSSHQPAKRTEFPAQYQTFGVVPLLVPFSGRVPFPLDWEQGRPTMWSP
jgi:hypothetical protein